MSAMMNNHQTDERSPEQEQGNRIHEIRIGKVQARIYRNVSQREGVYYRVKFLRVETDVEKVWTAKSFFREDLVGVAKAATASYIWLTDNTDFVPPPVVPVIARLRREDGPGENPTAHEVQVGNVLVSVWENTSRAGKVYHKVSFRRGELHGEEVWFLNSFRPEDLSHVAQAATSCRLWFGQMNGDGRPETGIDEGEKKRPAKQKPRRAAK